MLVCRECGCNFDNGELVNGVCLDCMEEEQQRQIRASAISRIMNSRSYQMRLDLDGPMEGETCPI